MKLRERRIAQVLGGLAVLVVLAPVLLAPTERALGERYVDGFGTQWWFWYAGELVAGRASFFHTDLLFYPTGKDVFTHTGGNLLDAMLALPLRAILGNTAGYNAWIAVVVATNFAAGARLGRIATGLPGWPAGIALSLNPYVLNELAGGRPTQAWLALPALALAGVWGATTLVEAVLTGLAVAASGWLYWYGGLVVGLLAAVLGLVRIVTDRSRNRRALYLAVSAMVAGIVVAPGVILMRDALASGAVPGLLALNGAGPIAPLAMTTMEGDSAGLHVLAPFLGVAGSLIDDEGLRFVGAEPSLGFATAGAALVGLVLAARARRWELVAGALCVALVAAIAATGPAIVVGSGFVVNRPWVWAASHVDLLRRWWWPGRAIFGLYLGLVMVIPLLARVRGLSWVFLAAVMIELVRTGDLPAPTWDAREPAPLRCLADAPPGAVVDLPFLADQHNLWFQTVHHHPLLSGMLVKKPAFGSAGALQLRAENGFLDRLLAYGELKVTQDPSFNPAEREALVALGFRYVVVDLSRMEGAAAGRGGATFNKSMWPRLRRLLTPMIGEPQAEGDGAAVYTLDGSKLGCLASSP
ncbi:hypothetical protein LBMAG42_39410 [Deltaproteobacteria bacterium]|nr:hypothetical protein LBMAG42_39410 [Deltaproteobacteria bacterium]